MRLIFQVWLGPGLGWQTVIILGWRDFFIGGFRLWFFFGKHPFAVLLKRFLVLCGNLQDSLEWSTGGDLKTPRSYPEY